jgi:GNAT superfamily N-acetyltransferase
MPRIDKVEVDRVPTEFRDRSNTVTGTTDKGSTEDTTVEKGTFPTPPVQFIDDEERHIHVHVYDDGVGDLRSMYRKFDDESRAQGMPPRGSDRIETWLEEILVDGLHLAASHGDIVVGHAMLLPITESRYELAIFVRPDYQLAGIGSQLIRTLLGYGQTEGVESVWLSVDRNNRVAKHLYQSVGFEPQSKGSEWEMTRSL